MNSLRCVRSPSPFHTANLRTPPRTIRACLASKKSFEVPLRPGFGEEQNRSNTSPMNGAKSQSPSSHGKLGKEVRCGYEFLLFSCLQSTQKPEWIKTQEKAAFWELHANEAFPLTSTRTVESSKWRWGNCKVKVFPKTASHFVSKGQAAKAPKVFVPLFPRVNWNRILRKLKNWFRYQVWSVVWQQHGRLSHRLSQPPTQQPLEGWPQG